MLYSASRRFIFSQAQRSASTSTAHFLQKYCCAPGTPISSGAMPEMVSEHGIIGARGPGRKESTFFSHMHARALQRALPAEVWQSSLKIANIRNPYTRILSVFSRLVRKGELGGTGGGGDLRGAFDTWFLHLDSTETYRPLFWIGQDLAVDHFIVFEDMAAQISALCKTLDIPPEPVFPHHQQSHDLIEGWSPQAMFSDAARARMLDRFQWVFDRFGYSTDPRDAQERPLCLNGPGRPQPRVAHA